MDTRIARGGAVVALALSACAGTTLAQTGGFVREGNTYFRIGNPSSSGAATTVPTADLSVNGAAGIDHLVSAGWFFRVGSATGQTQFNTTATNLTSSGFQPTAGAANAAVGLMSQTYAAQGFIADFAYTANDTPSAAFPNSGNGVMRLTITNTGTTPLTINLFNYVNIDAGGTAAGESATLTAPNQIRIADATSPWVVQYSAAGASGLQVGTAGGANDPLPALTGASSANFSGAGLPLNSADVSAAFQWTLTIDPGLSRSVVATVSVIPSPGAMALMGLGGLLVIRRKPR